MPHGLLAVLLAAEGWGLGGRALGSSSLAARAHVTKMRVFVRAHRAWLSPMQQWDAGCGSALRGGGGGTESEADGGEDESGRYVPDMMQQEVSVPARAARPSTLPWEISLTRAFR